MAQEKYIVITKSMLSLDLNANELIAYALIYGFCQDDETGFRGSIDYVAAWCRVQRRQAIYILKSLVEKGVVTKQEIPGQTCAYFAKGVQSIAPVQPIAPVQKNAQGGAVHCTGGVQSIAPNNIEDNTEKIQRESVLRAREDDGKKAYGTKVRMTPDEYAKIVSRYGSEDAAAMVQMLDDYLVDHPRKHYANHYRAAIGWPAQRLMEQRTAEQRLKNAQEAGQRVNGQQAPVTHYADLAEIDARRKAIEDKYSAIYNAKKNN